MRRGIAKGTPKPTRVHVGKRTDPARIQRGQETVRGTGAKRSAASTLTAGHTCTHTHTRRSEGRKKEGGAYADAERNHGSRRENTEN
jgi:hypothetical protein